MYTVPLTMDLTNNSWFLRVSRQEWVCPVGKTTQAPKLASGLPSSMPESQG